MAVAHKIAAFDVVELTERVDDAPAGARGGVLELCEGDMPMIEIRTEQDVGVPIGAPLFNERVTGRPRSA